MKYYICNILLGHVTCGNSTDTNVYIAANDIMEAQKKVRAFPMVKHKKYNAVTRIREITKEEYDEAIANGYNAYSFLSLAEGSGKKNNGKQHKNHSNM